MPSNYDKIAARYSQSNGEDTRESESRHNALEFHYTKKHLEGLITKEKRVLEVGSVRESSYSYFDSGSQ